MEKKYLILIFLCSIVFAFGQEITISGTVKSKDSSFILCSKSFDKKASHFMEYNEIFVTKNNSFQMEFIQSDIGLISLRSDSLRLYTVLICNSNDKIKIDYSEENGKIKANFQGTNADGLDLINNTKIINELFLPIASIFTESNASSEIITKVDNLKTTTMMPFYSLQKENKISKGFCDFVELYVESEIITMAYLYLDEFLKSDTNSPFQCKLSESEIVKTIQLIDSKYNVFDMKYDAIKTGNQYHNIINKCTFISKKALNGNYSDYGLWVSEEQKKYNFAPKNIQEFLAMKEILKNDFDSELYKRYEKNFPKGVYLKILNDKFQKSKKDKILPLFSFGNFDKDLNIVESKEYPTLQNLVETKFKGKAVFVDIWATYCGPCKAEFKYSNKLFEFLDSKDIAILYFSIDNEKAIGKWENDINKFNLKGFHYFGSEKIKEVLAKWLNDNRFGVPRYLLFDKNAKLVLTYASNPSTGQLLYDEIVNALK